MISNELTTKELASRFGVAEVTARLWCQKGLFPNGHQKKTPFGSYWLVPESDLQSFNRPKTGRPFDRGQKVG